MVQRSKRASHLVIAALGLACGVFAVWGVANGDWRPVVRSLPWNFSAESPQGYAAAQVEIEDECHVWTVRLIFQLDRSPGQWHVTGASAGKLWTHDIARAPKPEAGAHCGPTP